MLVAGCTSSGKAPAPAPQSTPTVAATTPTPQPPQSSVTAQPTPCCPPTVPVTSVVPTHTRTKTRPPSTTPLPSTVSTATTTQSTCTKVTLRVIPGGASAGEELAALQYTNDAAQPCVLTGYPTVTLQRHGKQIGQPSRPAQSVPHSIDLKPGATAESLLHDITNCQAPLSDTARITVPGTGQTLTHPLVLRACTLVVDPLGPPS